MDCGLPNTSRQQSGEGGVGPRREEQGNVPQFREGDVDMATGGPQDSKRIARGPMVEDLGNLRLEILKLSRHSVVECPINSTQQSNWPANERQH